MASFKFSHKHEQDTFWKLGGLPNSKLKQLEMQWQEDTSRIVKEAEERMEAEFSRRLSYQYLLNSTNSNAALEKALNEQREKYERIIQNLEAKINAQNELISDVTLSFVKSSISPKKAEPVEKPSKYEL